MLKKDTIFDFMLNVMVVFAVAILSISLFTLLFGSEAKDVSPIFALGEQGIPLSLIGQFLVLALLVTVLRWIFFTDHLIRKCSLTFRTIGMFIAVIMMCAVLIVIFRWFPVDMIESWVMFILCFAVCASVSVLLSGLKEKKDNEKLQEMLERFQEEERC